MPIQDYDKQCCFCTHERDRSRVNPNTALGASRENRW
jgi:hypothetical protein